LTGASACQQYINEIKRDRRGLPGGLPHAAIAIALESPVAAKAASILLCCTMIVADDWIVRKNQSISV
jgi:hypothetical protein